MSDIIKSQYLTAYNVDGLELFFTANRKAYAHTTAISRMCGMSQGAVYSHIVNVLGKPGVTQAKVNVGNRFQSIDLFPSKVIVACLKKYKPERLEQFMEFGVDEGLAQMAGVPLPQAKPQTADHPAMSQEEQMILMAQTFIDMQKLKIAAKQFPGDQRQMDSILSEDTPQTARRVRIDL
jgi:hypothetical protein